MRPACSDTSEGQAPRNGDGLDDDDGERPSQDPIRVLKLDVQHRAEDHPYLYIVIEGQGGREKRTREFVLSPYGAALLLRSVALKAKAEKALLAEACKHREWRLLKTCPGMGPIRTAELLPVVVTPVPV